MAKVDVMYATRIPSTAAPIELYIYEEIEQKMLACRGNARFQEIAAYPTVVFNGVEVERFAKATAWPTDGPTVLFLGRHEPRKGLAVLLEAVAHLPRHVQVWIAGDGPETDSLRARHAGDPRIH